MAGFLAVFSATKILYLVCILRFLVTFCFLNTTAFFPPSSVQSLSRVRLFATPWITARQATLSITNSRSSLRLTSIESVMPSSHLILRYPLLLLPPIPPSIRVFSNESTLRMRWPKYWRFSFSIIPSKEIQGWSPSERTGWISLQSKGLSRVFSNTTVLHQDAYIGSISNILYLITFHHLQLNNFIPGHH